VLATRSSRAVCSAALAGSPALAHAAHDLGHLLPALDAAFARFAGGCAARAAARARRGCARARRSALLGVGVIYGGRAQRVALCSPRRDRDRRLSAIRYAGAAARRRCPRIRFAQATWAVAQGIPTPVETQRLSALAESDALAARGLRSTRAAPATVARADELYQQLLATGVERRAGAEQCSRRPARARQTERAIELYGIAARDESPVVLFNLAQAYGRAFRVEDLNQTIAHAQRAGGDQIARLTALQSGNGAESFVADLPPPQHLFCRARMRSGPAPASRRSSAITSRRVGSAVTPTGVCRAAGALCCSAACSAPRVQPSRACRRCRERICQRCGPRGGSGDLCDGCTTLFFAPEKTDRVLRAERVNLLRAREERIAQLHTWLALFVPGAAGLVGERPLLCWLGATYFSLACAALFWRDGVVPDPLVAGAVAPAVFVGAAAFAAVGYAIAVAASLAARRQD
jgi:hypothetical protein